MVLLDKRQSRRIAIGYSKQHDKRFTPRDGEPDFSLPGLENGICSLRVERSNANKPVWAAAQAVLPPEPQEAVLQKISELRGR